MTATLTQPESPQSERRDIPGHPGYFACADGSVWTLWRFKGGGYGRTGSKFIGTTPKRLKASPRKEDGRGRLKLRCADGTYRRRYVSSFILEAFIGPCPLGLEACHKDGNCLNDAADNLRWDTSASNKADMIGHGTRLRGESINCAKLKESDVLDIRQASGPLKPLAEKYGVTESLICAVRKRKVWKHVQ